MVMRGGTQSNYSTRSSRQFISLSLHIQTPLLCLFLTSHQLMLLFHQMHWKPSRWTSQMRANSANNVILWFRIPIPLSNTMEGYKKCACPMDSLKTFSKYLKSMDSMLENYEWSAVPSAHGKMKPAAWLDSWASKMTLPTNHRCLRQSLRMQVMNASFFQSSTVNWILLKW